LNVFSQPETSVRDQSCRVFNNGPSPTLRVRMKSTARSACRERPFRLAVSHIFFPVCSQKVSFMFNLFRKDPLKKLEKEYAAKLEQGRDLQRKGDIVGYSRLAADADDILKQIEALEATRSAAKKV
jgi:hypothetical protein